MLLLPHLIVSLILVVILFPFFGFYSFVVLISGFFIDVDHIIFYWIRFKSFDLKRTYGYFIGLSEDSEERKRVFRIFHSIELIILIAILSLYHQIFAVLLAGFIVHLSMDINYKNSKSKNLKEFLLVCHIIKNIKMMKKIKPTNELKKAMDRYYNISNGYLKHLNKKRNNYFDYYLYFLSQYLIKVQPNSKVLEVGCGDGYSTYLLSKKYPKLKFIGSDVSSKFIVYAKKKFKNKNLKYKVEDSLNLSFDNNSVDMIISTDVVEHIPNVPLWLDESIRILRKDGLMIIVTGNHFSPIQPFLDIIRFEKRPPFAPTYFSQFKLLFLNLFMSFKKLIKPSFIYVEPDLRRHDGGDFDAVYRANQMDIVSYLKQKKMEILNVSFKGSDLFSKFCGYVFPYFSGMGIVAKNLDCSGVIYENKKY